MESLGDAGKEIIYCFYWCEIAIGGFGIFRIFFNGFSVSEYCFIVFMEKLSTVG
jgi:hypothetical protein